MINNIKVEIAFEYDVKCDAKKLESIRDLIDKKEGIYKFHDANSHELIYIGITNNLYARVYSYIRRENVKNQNNIHYFQDNS